MNGRSKYLQTAGKIKKKTLEEVIAYANDTIWSVEQAAEALGITANAVRIRLRRGTLPGHKRRGSSLWYLRKSEVIMFVTDEE